MANLRTNNLSGEGGRNAYDGSVFFDGAHSYLSLASGEVISGTGFGTGDFTVEFWINQQGNSGNYMGIITLTSTTAAKRFEVSFHSGTIQVYTDTGEWRNTGYTPVSGVYEHIVFQRDYSANTLKMYANGEEKWSVSNNRDYDEPFTTKIGLHNTSYNSLRGYLSNLRICIGHLVYSSNYFTPPTSPLTVHYTSDNDKTVLLCCQDSDNPLQEATGKTITGYGRHADSSIELVPNGGPTTDVTGWTAYNSSVAYEDGQIKVTRSGGTGFSAYATITNAVIGQRYKLSAQVRSASSRCDLYVTTAVASGTLLSLSGTASATVDVSGEFTATATTLYVFTAVDSDGDIGYYNRVSVKAADQGILQKFIPPYGVDAGNTFNGAISMNTPSYMYFPTGRTEERGGTRACWFRGYSQAGANDNIIDFSEMSSKGNAQDFGDTLSSNRQAGALGSSTRGVFGGRDGGSNVIEFVTFSTQSNSLDFGDFTAARSGSPATASDGTRGLFFGGYTPNHANANIIEYITIATLGDGTDFGDLTDKSSETMGCASPTRAIRFGGRLASPASPGSSDVIDYTTIQSVGNATDFGNLTVARSEGGGASSDTRGVCFAGYSYSPNTGRNTIDYITIASTGDAQDFGDLSAYTQSWQGGSGSNNVIIAHGYGYNNSARDNRIDFITIATTGNSVDYGDLTNQRSQIPCATNGHGGLY